MAEEVSLEKLALQKLKEDFILVWQKNRVSTPKNKETLDGLIHRMAVDMRYATELHNLHSELEQCLKAGSSAVINRFGVDKEIVDSVLLELHYALGLRLSETALKFERFIKTTNTSEKTLPDVSKLLKHTLYKHVLERSSKLMGQYSPLNTLVSESPLAFEFWFEQINPHYFLIDALHEANLADAEIAKAWEILVSRHKQPTKILRELVSAQWLFYRRELEYDGLEFPPQLISLLKLQEKKALRLVKAVWERVHRQILSGEISPSFLSFFYAVDRVAKAPHMADSLAKAWIDRPYFHTDVRVDTLAQNPFRLLSEVSAQAKPQPWLIDFCNGLYQHSRQYEQPALTAPIVDGMLRNLVVDHAALPVPIAYQDPERAVVSSAQFTEWIAEKRVGRKPTFEMAKYFPQIFETSVGVKEGGYYLHAVRCSFLADRNVLYFTVMLRNQAERPSTIERNETAILEFELKLEALSQGLPAEQTVIPLVWNDGTQPEGVKIVQEQLLWLGWAWLEPQVQAWVEKNTTAPQQGARVEETNVQKDEDSGASKKRKRNGKSQPIEPQTDEYGIVKEVEQPDHFEISPSAFDQLEKERLATLYEFSESYSRKNERCFQSLETFSEHRTSEIDRDTLQTSGGITFFRFKLAAGVSVQNYRVVTIFDPEDQGKEWVIGVVHHNRIERKAAMESKLMVLYNRFMKWYPTRKDKE